VAPGARRAANEPFGTLIDPTRLEVALHLTAAQFARLQAPDGSLPTLPVTVLPGAGRMAPGTEPVTLAATLDRPAAEVAEGRTGREVFARLDAPTTLLRPGDFVGVLLHEPVLRAVARLPASAVSETGHVLLVGAGDRLQEQAVRILRREGDSVVVADLPDGARYVTVRRPSLGTGVLIRAVGGDETDTGGRPEARRGMPEPGRG
jgi:multidrug efflux pump subunit AcrA (membrane-fusion protein)